MTAVRRALAVLPLGALAAAAAAAPAGAADIKTDACVRYVAGQPTMNILGTGFTPNGFVQQGETNGNPWQAHRSGWSAARLRELGFRVHGVRGVRGIRGELSEPRWRPRWAWKLVSDLTQPVALRLPALAFQLLCVKEIRHSGPVSLGERARIAAL